MSLFSRPWCSTLVGVWVCVPICGGGCYESFYPEKGCFSLEETIINCKILTAKIMKPLYFKICLNLIAYLFIYLLDYCSEKDGNDVRVW